MDDQIRLEEDRFLKNSLGKWSRLKSISELEIITKITVIKNKIHERNWYVTDKLTGNSNYQTGRRYYIKYSQEEIIWWSYKKTCRKN